jgi:hypothetical protein
MTKGRNESKGINKTLNFYLPVKAQKRRKEGKEKSSIERSEDEEAKSDEKKKSNFLLPPSPSPLSKAIKTPPSYDSTHRIHHTPKRTSRWLSKTPESENEKCLWRGAKWGEWWGRGKYISVFGLSTEKSKAFGWL